MTTYADMKALVEAQTRRPEIPAITQTAIQLATLRAHHVDFFPRDLNEGTLTFDVNGSVFYDFFNLSNSLSRFRILQSVVGLDSATFAPVEELEYRELSDLYDSDNCLRPSIYTLIGDTLRCYFQQPTGRVCTYYYKNPTTTTDGYSSWIADSYPDELALWAAAIVYARTGFAEMAREHQEFHIKPFKDLLIASHLLGSVS